MNATIRWQKSTYNGDGSNCVEIAVTNPAIHIRDSKNTDGPHLTLNEQARQVICPTGDTPRPTFTSNSRSR